MIDLYISYCTRCTSEKVQDVIKSYLYGERALSGVTVRLDGSDCHMECDGGPVQFRANGETRLYLENSDDPEKKFNPFHPETEMERMIHEALGTEGDKD